MNITVAIQSSSLSTALLQSLPAVQPWRECPSPVQGRRLVHLQARPAGIQRSQWRSWTTRSFQRAFKISASRSCAAVFKKPTFNLSLTRPIGSAASGIQSSFKATVVQCGQRVRRLQAVDSSLRRVLRRNSRRSGRRCGRGRFQEVTRGVMSPLQLQTTSFAHSPSSTSSHCPS